MFVANEWNDWDSNDCDFGSCSPAYTPLPAGSTPAGVVIAPAKPGRIHFLDATNLSQGKYDPTSMVNTNGQLAELTVSNTMSESIYTSPTVYSTASGLHTAINVGNGAMNCPTAVTGNEAIVSVLLTPGATFGAKVAWCAAVGSGGGSMNFPPILDDVRRRERGPHRLVPRGQSAQGGQRRHRRRDCDDDGCSVQHHPEPELSDRGQEPDRRLRPRTPLLVVTGRDLRDGAGECPGQSARATPQGRPPMCTRRSTLPVATSMIERSSEGPFAV